MKKIVLYFSVILLFVSCSSAKKELFKETDQLVESLETTYESYGLLDGTKHAKTTSDGLYKITPFGRLINVKIQKVVEDEEYENLKQDLESHYKSDKRVNDVYINQGGTIMIDCRN